MLVSGAQQSDLVICILTSFLFQILFPCRLLQSIESHSLCYTVGPCWLSVLCIVVCMLISTSEFIPLIPPPTFPMGNHKFVNTGALRPSRGWLHMPSWRVDFCRQWRVSLTLVPPFFLPPLPSWEWYWTVIPFESVLSGVCYRSNNEWDTVPAFLDK